MVAKETSLAKPFISQEILQAAQELGNLVHQAAKDGVAAHEVERKIWDSVLAMGHTAFQQFLDLQGTGDLGQQLTLPDGLVVNHLDELKVRPYVSIFGHFQIKRVVYSRGKKKKIDLAPLDTRLSLPPTKFSYLLQDWDQIITTEQPYEKVSELLERMLGLEQHVDTLEGMSRQMTDDAEAFCWSRQAPPADEEGELLVQTADGKGVPIRHAADAAVIEDHQQRPGPKPDRKKMATIGSVYSVDRFRRTAEEVVQTPFHRPDDEPLQWDRPKPCHKHVYASLTHQDEDGNTIEAEPCVCGWMADHVQARNPHGMKTLVAIMDGQESLWNTKDALQEGVDMVEVLDLLHVTPRLWTLAHMFHPEDTKQREQFVRQRVLRILRGDSASVVRGIRYMATSRKLSKKKRKKAAQICGYFDNNAQRMRYDVYLARGYPIASGVIEGACRHVVKDRMERTGMSWRIPGARAVLLLRAISTTQQWDDFMQYRIEHEVQRIHKYHAVIEQVEWALAM